MKDFKESLLAGIKAAKESSINKEEIRVILISVSEQVKAISDNKATFGICTLRRENKNIMANHLAALASTFAAATGVSNAEKYQALAIFDVNGKNGIEVAEWSEGDSGYPCMIKFNKQKVFCGNRVELENTLSELLKEVKTGEAILEQIYQHDKKENNDNDNDNS